MCTWDPVKNASNQVKHGVSFENAQRVFEDPLHLTRKDQVVDGEQRWITIGRVAGTVLLLVAHTLEDDETEIRIVSARKPTRHERYEYENS